jgi:hypothetical protein
MAIDPSDTELCSVMVITCNDPTQTRFLEMTGTAPIPEGELVLLYMKRTDTSTTLRTRLRTSAKKRPKARPTTRKKR